MSLVGVESKEETLISALLEKDEKKALQRLKDPNIDLHQKAKGLEAIHLAAQMGSKKVFRELVKKGVSPFVVDSTGHSPYHYARVSRAKKIVALYEDFISLPMTLNLQRAEEEVNDALLSAGLSVYSLPMFEAETDDDVDAKDKIREFLTQVLAKGQVLKFLQKDISAKKKEKITKVILIDPSFLAETIAGLCEEISPVELLIILSQSYSSLALPQKLSCLYLVKEIVCYEGNQKMVASIECRKVLFEFLSKQVNDNFAIINIGTKLKSLYFSKCSPSHLLDAQALALDLTKIYRERTLDISPDEFLGDNLVKNASQNAGLLRLTALNNQVSSMVCLDVLETPTIERAAQVVSFYLDVIAYCLNEKQDGVKREYNFAAALMIISGLQYNAIDRLKGIEELLSSPTKKQMKRYIELFKPTGVFRNLQELMAEYPNCIAPINIYTGRKTNLMDKPLTQRLLSLGKLNRQFQMQRQYLISLDALDAPLQTDLADVIARTIYDEEQAYYYSFSIVAPKVIALDDKPSADDVIRQLKDCKAIKCPLVVRINNQQYSKTNALTKIKEFFAESMSVDDIVILCEEVISIFEKTNKTVKSDLASIDALADEVADLSLDAKKSSKRKPSFTTDDVASSSSVTDMVQRRHHRSTTTVGFAPDVRTKEERLAQTRKNRMGAFQQIKGTTSILGFSSSPSQASSADDVASAALAPISPSITPMEKEKKRASSKRSDPLPSSSATKDKDKDKDKEKERVKKK